MKNIIIVLSLFVYLLLANTVKSQTLDPAITFTEHPQTHNMHICSDGKYYYTVNGGVASEGLINKFSLKGELIDTYSFNLDMRTIVYRKKDKSFYVSTYEGNIYKITELEYGKYEMFHEGIYSDGQSCLGIDTKGEKLYEHSYGTIYVYDFETGELLKSFDVFRYAKEMITGSNSIAVTKKSIILFNGNAQYIYKYDLDGNFIEEIKISEGTYGPSVSFAKKYVFVSDDGDYETGTWYGYKIK
ncbi:MAG: hypothetical protein C0596_14840 [Marinilabiliales bacterium]|nr:MAG: hypothetical protein C0596_14840 [Marinilabiliales bacterium]